MPRRHWDKTKPELIQYIYELEGGVAGAVVGIIDKTDKLAAIIQEICDTKWGQSLGLARWKRWKRELPAALRELRAAIGEKAKQDAGYAAHKTS